MCISNYGKVGSEPESQDRQDLSLEIYPVGSIFPFSGFVHTQSH